jgi:hypothetical protein
LLLLLFTIDVTSDGNRFTRGERIDERAGVVQRSQRTLVFFFVSIDVLLMKSIKNTERQRNLIQIEHQYPNSSASFDTSFWSARGATRDNNRRSASTSNG